MKAVHFHLILDRVKITINLLRKSDIFRNHATVNSCCWHWVFDH